MARRGVERHGVAWHGVVRRDQLVASTAPAPARRIGGVSAQLDKPERPFYDPYVSEAGKHVVFADTITQQQAARLIVKGIAALELVGLQRRATIGVEIQGDQIHLVIGEIHGDTVNVSRLRTVVAME